MSFLEAVRVALEGIWTNKLRSSLTMLGIVIGIGAVIAVVAIGQGGQALLLDEVSKAGSNLFAVYVDYTSEEPATTKDFQIEDIEIIKKLVPSVAGITTFQESYTSVEGPDKKKMARITGVTGDYKKMHNVELLKGSFFSNHDAKSTRAVVIIDEKLAEEIFGRQDPLGKRILIKSKPFMVIGISQAEEGLLAAMGGMQAAFIPISSYQQVFNDKTLMGIQVQTASREQIEPARQQVIKILERRHDNKDRYTSVTLEQQMETINRITSIMTLIVGAIAGISLFVGGIGVMNIMLVSVTERTREIGIRKALGAQRKDIMVQFLIEALVICLIGGIIGTILGVGCAYLIAEFANWPPLVSWGTIVIAFLFSSFIGIFFGLYPASQAAKLDPIEALRYE